METLNNRSRRELLDKLLGNSGVVIGSVILLIMILIAIFAPFIAPHDPTETNSAVALMGPMEGYPLGTDELGRCLFSRMVYGARITILSFIGGYHHRCTVRIAVRLLQTFGQPDHAVYGYSDGFPGNVIGDHYRSNFRTRAAKCHYRYWYWFHAGLCTPD